MTIAAGFVATDGILLCTDSQFTGEQKVFKRKIFFQPGPISAGFALSGDVEFARSTIQDFFEALHRLPENERTISSARGAIKGCLSKMAEDYRKSARDPNLQPQFLAALTDHNLAQTQLFVTSETTVSPVERFELLGSGSYLGDYVMRAFHEMTLDFMTIEDFVLAGLWVISAARSHDAFVGGGAQFLAIGRSGQASGIGSYRFEQADDWLLRFDQAARRLFLVTASTRSTPQEFKELLDGFVRDAEAFREIIHRPGSMIQGIVESLRNINQPSSATTSEISHTWSVTPAAIAGVMRSV